MNESVEWGVRRADGQVLARSSWKDAAGSASLSGGTVVCRVVRRGGWGPAPSKCPIHFLTYCADCGWV